MNGIFRYTVTDAQRQLIAGVIDGRLSKRLATRVEIAAILDGALTGACEALTDSELPAHERVPFDPTLVPKQYQQQPLSWQRGWWRGRYNLRPFSQ